jgi:glucose/arabinose dehydrogenase
MTVSGIFAQLVAFIGAMAIWFRGGAGRADSQAVGVSPAIPLAQEQAVPSLKVPTARGWPAGRTPVPRQGLKANAFATGLDHPRQIYVLPSGDVLVAESCFIPWRALSLFDYALQSTLKRAGAVGASANRITLLADRDGDGVAEVRETFLSGLSQPFGMALIGDTFYVGNTDGLVAFPFDAAQTRITGPAKTLLSFKTGGHWTRNLIVGADSRKLYVSVGSLSNVGESGLDAEKGRACIYEVDLASGSSRVFASGLRNPVGLAIEPSKGAIWTVVNERDGLGDETPPDYLTSVRDEGFYGWPFCYWGQTVDTRIQTDKKLIAESLTPDYALGGHTASLGLCWVPQGTLPNLSAGMAIGQHGSWNRSTLSGYKMIFVPFADGRPAGPPEELLTGFLSADERDAYGRPVGTAVGPDGSLLLADDVGNVIWRVTAA